jgi:glycosyltransferase involved in cell wall biosynthesis
VLLDILFLSILGAGAYYDNKKNSVSDYIPAALMVLSPFYSTDPLLFVYLGSLIIANTYFYNKQKKEFIGWSDILVLPPFMAYTFAVPYTGFFFILTLVYYANKKIKIALYVPLFYSAFFGFLAHYLLTAL